MILFRRRLFLNSSIIKVAIKDKKIFTIGLLIDIDGTAYTQRLNHVLSCKKCQHHNPFQPEKALHPTWIAFL